MKIKIKMGDSLREAVGESQIRFDLPDGATAAEALAHTSSAVRRRSLLCYVAWMPPFAIGVRDTLRPS